MEGFYGRFLYIDVSDRSFRIEPLPQELLSKTLGGKGLATHLLLKLNPPGVDPLAPENHVIFCTGPLCQSSLWGACRYGVYTKSPLTGYYAESYAGGSVPEAIDSAGYDAIVITGKSENPVVLTVHPEGCYFHDAQALWGMDTFETEDKAKADFALDREDYREPGAVVIGPAAENLVRFGVIENDYWRSAGRTGVGTVMGSKYIKAIVFHGNCKRSSHDPEAIREYSKNFSKASVDDPGVKAYRSLGTTMMVAIMNRVKAFPAKYWSLGTCDHWENISGEFYHEHHDIKPHGCRKCFMVCGRLATITGGRHRGLKIEGPEYETIYAFGGLCMVDKIDEIAYLNDICDRLGIDTITAGNLCGLAIEASRRGKIDYSIDYGDVDGIANLLRDIAFRRGIGDILADGIRSASKKLGVEELAVHVKGLEPAGYDPRVLKGMGLSYGVSDRGACHLRTTFYKPELAGIIAPDAIEGKAELVIDYEDRLVIFDSLILCRFYRDLYTWDELVKVIQMMTGISLAVDGLREIASNIVTMTRRFNLQEGLKPEEDRLPKRLHRESLPTGHRITEEEMETLLHDYYRLRGWSSEGIPPEEG